MSRRFVVYTLVLGKAVEVTRFGSRRDAEREVARLGRENRDEIYWAEG